MSKPMISGQVGLAEGSVVSIPLLPDVYLSTYSRALVHFHHVPIQVSERSMWFLLSRALPQERYASKAPLVFVEIFVLLYSEL